MYCTVTLKHGLLLRYYLHSLYLRAKSGYAHLWQVTCMDFPDCSVQGMAVYGFFSSHFKWYMCTFFLLRLCHYSTYLPTYLPTDLFTCLPGIFYICSTIHLVIIARIYLFIYPYRLSICLPTYIFTYFLVYLSIFLSIYSLINNHFFYLSILYYLVSITQSFKFIHPIVCVSIYPTINSTICLCIHLSIHSPTYLFTYTIERV